MSLPSKLGLAPARTNGAKSFDVSPWTSKCISRGEFSMFVTFITNLETCPGVPHCGTAVKTAEKGLVAAEGMACALVEASAARPKTAENMQRKRRILEMPPFGVG